MILYTSTLSPAGYLPACSFVGTGATLGNRPLLLGIAHQPVHRQESLPMAFVRGKRTTSGRASQTLSTAVFLHSMSESAQAASFKQNQTSCARTKRNALSPVRACRCSHNSGRFLNNRPLSTDAFAFRIAGSSNTCLHRCDNANRAGSVGLQLAPVLTPTIMQPVFT